MKKFYQGLSESDRFMFWLVVVAIVGFILLVPFAFFDYYSIPLGWLWGNLGGLVAMLLLKKQATVVSETKISKKLILYFYGRFILYAATLVTPLLLEYFNLHILNIYSAFIGLLVFQFVVIISGRKVK